MLGKKGPNARLAKKKIEKGVSEGKAKGPRGENTMENVRLKREKL